MYLETSLIYENKTRSPSFLISKFRLWTIESTLKVYTFPVISVNVTVSPFSSLVRKSKPHDSEPPIIRVRSYILPEYLHGTLFAAFSSQPE